MAEPGKQPDRFDPFNDPGNTARVEGKPDVPAPLDAGIAGFVEAEGAAAPAPMDIPVEPDPDVPVFVAKETAAKVPDAPPAKAPVAIKPPVPPPPPPADLAKFAEGNSDIPQEQKSAREQRMERGQQAANERRERMGKAPKFPQFKPPAEVPLDMLGVEQLAAPGDEQARVMQQRAAGALDAINRVFDAQNKLLAKFQGMLAAHEQKLHELDGLLERSRR